MSKPTSAPVPWRLGAVIAITFAVLTVILLATYGARQVPAALARGAGTGAVLQLLLLSVPFTAALTMPMAVFVAVMWVGTRPGTVGVEPRPFLVTTLRAASVVTVLALVSNTLVVPRANARLAEVLANRPAAGSDRVMTISELREAERSVRASGAPGADARAASYEVEVQKKFALAAACLVLALAGAALTTRMPRGDALRVGAASAVVFGAYYILLVTGESFADRLVISPVVAMWSANVLLLAIALAAMRTGRGRGTPQVAELATER